MLRVKDYYCSDCKDGPYIECADVKLWLYINLTDQCNARCPFCVHPQGNSKAVLDPMVLKKTLKKIAPHVKGVSITGGEPMLYPDLVDEVASIVDETFDLSVELDLVTNGTNLAAIPELRYLDRFSSIHISRHKIDDKENAELMGFSAPTIEEIKSMILGLNDKGKIVFNCTMQNRGVENLKDMAEYLEMAAAAGVRNSSFIGFFPANDYCTENYISPAEIDITEDKRFRVWNQYFDHEFCSCSSGDYNAKAGPTRFYYRCPGKSCSTYCRQLVYNADNSLLDGFRGNRII